MPAKSPILADPPAEDLDSLEPVYCHSYQWKRRKTRSPKRTAAPEQEERQVVVPVPETEPEEAMSCASALLSNRDDLDLDLESRLLRLEGVVRDCALVLRSSVAGRLEKIESSLASETARLDEKIHGEARQRCRVLTEVAQKVSAAIDQIRLEASRAAAPAPAPGLPR